MRPYFLSGAGYAVVPLSLPSKSEGMERRVARPRSLPDGSARLAIGTLATRRSTHGVGRGPVRAFGQDFPKGPRRQRAPRGAP